MLPTRMGTLSLLISGLSPLVKVANEVFCNS